MKSSRPKIPLWIIKRMQELLELQCFDVESSKSKNNKKERFGIKCHAFDTETLHGYCKLLACDNGEYVLIDKKTKSPEQTLLKFLCKRKFRNTLNFFYNIDYDVAAIFKYLPRKNIEELMYLTKTHYKNFDITYIPRKCLLIQHNKNTVKYFDLWQYYHMSLEKAASTYLNGEHKDPMDRELLGTSERYWKEHLDDIIKYCIQDCVLTRKLAEILQHKLNEIGISFDDPYSTGTIAIKYTRNYYDFPRFRLYDWDVYAYMAYFGGRFEVVRKGYFDKVYINDINSAYPYQLTNLIDTSRGKWHKTTTLDEDADLGFYKIIIEKSDDSLIQPFCFRSSAGLVYYPRCEKILHYATLDEILFALNNYDIEITILDGWVFYADEYYYPFAFLHHIYNKRKEVKKSDPVLQLILKIIMNSLYGKFAEKVPIYLESSLQNATDFIKIDGKSIPVAKYIRPGNVFNPVYAAYITARTRLMLLEHAHKHEDNIVAMFTDSILSTKNFISSSSELGGWDLENEGEALIVGCGVYTIRNDECIKTRLRGIHVKNSLDLIKVAEENKNKTEIELSWNKAIKPKETLMFCNKYDVEMINHIIPYSKHISVRMDRKRRWFNDPLTFGQLLKDSYESMPLVA